MATKSAKKPVGRAETLFDKSLTIIFQKVSEAKSCGRLQKFGRNAPMLDEVLSPHKQEIYPTVSFIQNVNKVDFQTQRTFCVELFGSETKTCQ